jgi:hypothetical protein
LETFRANGAFRHIKDRICRAVPSLFPENNYFLFLKNVHNLSAINDIAIYELSIYTFTPTLAILRDHHYKKDEHKIMVCFHCNQSKCKIVVDVTNLIIIKKINVIDGYSFGNMCRDIMLRVELYKLLFD